jgi:hypothetical protein
MTARTRQFDYIGVSTVVQRMDRQTDALTAGVRPDDIYSDKINGATP